MNKEIPFKKIAVIGAGTMGSGIAGQIANANQPVTLLDIPGEKPNSITEKAIEKLIKSDPPALMHKSKLNLITIGNTRDDFDKLSECDWIIEAVVEKLEIKKDLYQRIEKIVKPDCVITSNTSTIPIKLLVEDMPLSFRERFAITHYFNPVRFMRLLELVRGENTKENIMLQLADYNDRILGKGVVTCSDTPGFLGNRVGVFALQVGIAETYNLGLSIQEADALMGRPMGIPKTGIFGLYDLIGIDLMADVVDTLGTILPKNDPFHDVGAKKIPISLLITEMINNGYTGNKGKGGFYRLDENNSEFVLDIINKQLRPKEISMPLKAIRASEQLLSGEETLFDLIENKTHDTNEKSHTNFCRRVLGRVLGYAASLIPEITNSPQDIDDAMKLGFNWIRGPFEIIDKLGVDVTKELINEVGLTIPNSLDCYPFYKVDKGKIFVNCMNKNNKIKEKEIKLPPNAIRFHLTRKTLKPIMENRAASTFNLKNNIRLIEFHSKANTLDDDSMAIILETAKDPGSGIIIHNDAQHFSSGVNLNTFLKFIKEKKWVEIDNFLQRFQSAVKTLKYCPVPVIGAPSGLAIGGGFEVLLHSDMLIIHSNSVLGLVEAGVGVVPGGGGVKETYLRCLNKTENPDDAAWQAWMQIGYGKTGTSPEKSAELLYFLDDKDKTQMNRDYLLHSAILEINKMNQKGYIPPKWKNVKLPGNKIISKMESFMDEGITKGHFFPHDKTVAMTVASIVVNSENINSIEITEDELYAREREAFIKLAKSKLTYDRISGLIEKGITVRN